MPRPVSKRRQLCGAVIALRPTHNKASAAKSLIAHLDRQIVAARAAGNQAKADDLDTQRARLIVHSLT